MVVVKIRLTPEDGAQFINAIERAAKELKAQQGDGEDSIARMPYSTSRADALMHAIVQRADAEVQVHVCAETLSAFDSEGCCHLHDGPNLAPHTVRRLACDAGVVRIVEDGNGQPLDVGRKTRTISPALKRALMARDQGCRFPGCAATRHLHGHHVEHWADGGATALDNLLQLCPHHHRLVHEGGFKVQAMYERECSKTVFRFLRPDHTIIKDVVPQFEVGQFAEQLLKQGNAQLGLAIDETTAQPNWDGEPMDRAMAIDCMFSASGDFEVRGPGVTAETFGHELVEVD